MGVLVGATGKGGRVSVGGGRGMAVPVGYRVGTAGGLGTGGAESPNSSLSLMPGSTAGRLLQPIISSRLTISKVVLNSTWDKGS